MARGPDSCRHQ